MRANSCDKAMNNGPHFLQKDYSVLDLLGKGGFACVYRAKCKNNGLEVAIKMVSFGNTDNLFHKVDHQ